MAGGGRKGKKHLEITPFIQHKAFAKTYWNEDYHPLELTIRYDKQSIQIRSKISDFLKLYHNDIRKATRDDPKSTKYILQGYFSEKKFMEIMNGRQFPVFDLLMDEIDLITRIIRYYEPFDPANFTAQNFTAEYARHTTEICHILDDSIKDMYITEMTGLFAKNIDPSKSKEVFRISNYFIHYINWDNTFHCFCDMTFEVMPRSFRIVENYLSDRLRTAIKAYMAYMTQVNIIRRHFEKIHPGTISTLSFFEWKDYIQDYLMRNFEKIFGAKKAKQYIESLDQVLTNQLKNSLLTS